MKKIAVILAAATIFISGTAAAGGISGALEGADKQVQAVKDKFDDSMVEDKQKKYDNGLITVEDDDLVNRSGVAKGGKAVEETALEETAEEAKK